MNIFNNVQGKSILVFLLVGTIFAFFASMFIVFVLPVFGVPVISESLPLVAASPSPTAWEDSDGGKNPEYPGHVTGQTTTSCTVATSDIFRDQCNGPIHLYEQYVFGLPSYTCGDHRFSETYNCQNYCFNLYGGHLADGYCETVGQDAQCTCPQHG